MLNKREIRMRRAAGAKAYREGKPIDHVAPAWCGGGAQEAWYWDGWADAREADERKKARDAEEGA